MSNYTARYVREIQNSPGIWDTKEIGVFDGDNQIGLFGRNYHSFGIETFAPFERDGKWYALCSPHYTGISIMKLPECEIIGGEAEASHGFCPVEIYIPKYQVSTIPATSAEELQKYPKSNHSWPSKNRSEREYDPDLWNDGSDYRSCQGPELFETFAFVSGCVWGDDSSWKIELRDISRAHEGIITRVEWGYHELPPLPLKDCVRLSAFEQNDGEPKRALNVYVTVSKTIRLKIEKDIEPEFFD